MSLMWESHILQKLFCGLLFNIYRPSVPDNYYITTSISFEKFYYHVYLIWEVTAISMLRIHAQHTHLPEYSIQRNLKVASHSYNVKVTADPAAYSLLYNHFWFMKYCLQHCILMSKQSPHEHYIHRKGIKTKNT